MSSCQIFPLTWQDRYYNIIIIISILWEMCGFYPSPNSNPAVETELELGPLWPYAPRSILPSCPLAATYTSVPGVSFPKLPIYP